MHRNLLITLLGLLLSLSACNNEEKPAPDADPKPDPVTETVPKLEPSDDFSYVMKTTTEYYAGGPQQARPADGELQAGTKINVIEDSGSYTLVETEAGVKGYVSTSAIGR